MALAPSERTESSATFDLPSTQPLTAAARASAILLGEGYRLEEGTATAAVYGVGSGLMRIRLGAFARRNRFRVTVDTHESGFRLTVASAMSGTSGRHDRPPPPAEGNRPHLRSV